MSRTILIVEDNDMFRGMMSSLISLRGHQVIVARNGAEGLAMAAAQPFDAALVDVEMPGMDGFEFCRRLRAQGQATGQDVPVWIMTGVFRPALSKRANEAGAKLVLRKPFHVEEFITACELELQARAAGAAENDDASERGAN
jgi:two-component system, sensor histidine kinase